MAQRVGGACWTHTRGVMSWVPLRLHTSPRLHAAQPSMHPRARARTSLQDDIRGELAHNKIFLHGPTTQGRMVCILLASQHLSNTSAEENKKCIV